MRFSQQLKQQLSEYSMLNHPFYQAWTNGELKKETLQNYAVQYKPFVDAFPRLVSRIHSQCEDPADRRQLILNLIEEEGFPKGTDHPTLWKNFATGLGVVADDFEAGPFSKDSMTLVNEFWDCCNSSYSEGLAALYAYEHQIPEVARVKIDGLKKNYQIEDAKTIEFFSVHETADELHSESCEQLLDKLSPEEQVRAREAALRGAKAIWNFLSSCQDGECTHLN